MVFQHFALLPWADVVTNVAFGLDLRGVARAERECIAMELIRGVGLSGFERHLPWQLSGGMQQRVGLARALAIDPRTLLMDEPFSAVDDQTRRELQEDLLRLHAERRQAVLFVTHSMDEAVRLGDRVVLLTPRPGRIREVIDVPLPRPQAARPGAASRVHRPEGVPVGRAPGDARVTVSAVTCAGRAGWTSAGPQRPGSLDGAWGPWS